MKANVDLTENRDFNTSNATWDWLIRRKPYDPPKLAVPEVPHDIDDEDNWGIIQGNALKRKIKSFADEFGAGELCDCCGKHLYPYYHNTICQKCQERMDYIEPLWRN